MKMYIKAILFTLLAFGSAVFGNYIASLICGKPMSVEMITSTFTAIVAIDYFEFKFKQEKKNEKENTI